MKKRYKSNCCGSRCYSILFILIDIIIDYCERVFSDCVYRYFIIILSTDLKIVRLCSADNMKIKNLTKCFGCWSPSFGKDPKRDSDDVNISNRNGFTPSDLDGISLSI